MKVFLLVLCVLGAALPYSQFLPWVVEHGFNVTLFFQELFSTNIGGFFGLDVIISAVVLLLFIYAEGTRLGMKGLWIPVVATLSVGVSLGFPLFLYMRQMSLEKVKAVPLT